MKNKLGITEDNSKYQEANAKLHLDAHNTALKCQKLPSQLLAEHEEMKAMLKDIMESLQEGESYHASEIEQLLTKINQ